MLTGTQISLEDVNEEYKAFVDKFKPKKTTDDCYTPVNIFEAVKNWAVKEYHLEGREIVRPFWPGGDYERHHYPEGCVVIDNPPFSILVQIIQMYEKNGIDFFLFAPYLTNFSSGQRCSHIIAASQITYENGAEVPTAFVTNLDEYCLRAVPDLNQIIKAENDKNLKEKRRELPKYTYPDEVCTASMLGYMANHDTPFAVRFEDCRFTRQLASQKATGKGFFGGGFFLSEKAAAEKAAAEKAAAEKAAAEKAAAIRWPLSPQERALIQSLGRRDRCERTVSNGSQVTRSQR